MPKVSVVVPTYQRSDILGHTLAALITQTLTDIEIIVADDGSADDTPSVVTAVGDTRMRYLGRSHLGMPRILNEGFAAAGGEYIMTCHDHDGYAPTLLEELAGALDRYPTASFAHCAVVVVDAGERVLERYVRDYPSLMPGKSFMTQALLPGIACPVTALCMVRASALRGKALDPYFGPCADVELWLRLCTVGDVAYVKKELIRIRQRGPDSEFNELGCALASYTLAAKRAYSGWLDSDRQRAAVERGWRREADYTAFSQLLKGLQGRKRVNCAELLAFLRENGSTTGVVALTAVSRLPARFAERMLCLATPVAKAFAGMRVAAEQLPE